MTEREIDQARVVPTTTNTDSEGNFLPPEVILREEFTTKEGEYRPFTILEARYALGITGEGGYKRVREVMKAFERRDIVKVLSVSGDGRRANEWILYDNPQVEEEPEALTPRQLETLKFIEEYIADRLDPPTLMEISPTSAPHLVGELEDKGYLVRGKGWRRMKVIYSSSAD